MIKAMLKSTWDNYFKKAVSITLKAKKEKCSKSQSPLPVFFEISSPSLDRHW